ncbi:MAG: hypothetical protein NDI94_00045 [Candidatus Woesearchaeota archaeon]|nr:hypothetical protein [Candidatus Woesearchaeota archaeon]
MDLHKKIAAMAGKYACPETSSSLVLGYGFTLFYERKVQDLIPLNYLMLNHQDEKIGFFHFCGPVLEDSLRSVHLTFSQNSQDFDINDQLGSPRAYSFFLNEQYRATSSKKYFGLAHAMITVGLEIAEDLSIQAGPRTNHIFRFINCSDDMKRCLKHYDGFKRDKNDYIFAYSKPTKQISIQVI